MTVNFNDFFFIHQSLEQPIAASCSLVRSSPIWGKPGRLPFGCSDGTRERIHLPRPYLLKLERVRTRILRQPPLGCESRGETRRARLRGQRRPLLLPTWFPGLDAGLPARRAAGPLPAPCPSPRAQRQEERCSARSRLGGRTPPFDSRYQDGEHRNGLRPSLLEESLSCCKRVSGCPVGSTRTPAFRVGFTTVGEAEDARTRAARVKTPPRRHQPVAPLYAAAGRGSLGVVPRAPGSATPTPQASSALGCGARFLTDRNPRLSAPSPGRPQSALWSPRCPLSAVRPGPHVPGTTLHSDPSWAPSPGEWLPGFSGGQSGARGGEGLESRAGKSHAGEEIDNLLHPDPQVPLPRACWEPSFAPVRKAGCGMESARASEAP